ncbi:MAG: DUF4412 domain-containing protein [Flavobacteriaceae bacterium]|nr:DUF4412 domain-containing protein [Flavobacteriaceae bacterium]
MKTLKIIATILIFAFTTNTNAQFLKKLKEKATQKVEREAERRAQRRVDKKIDDTFDKAENKIDQTLSKKGQKSVKSLELFEFTHVYTMEMTFKKDVIVFEYYLKNNANFLAVNFPNMKTNMISIMDLDQGKNIALMENGGQKTQMTMKFGFKETVKEANEDIKITKTGNTKKILGYTCYEYDVTGKDFNSKAWVTNEAGISFPKDFQGSGNKKMKNQNNNWMFEMDGMVLEMIVTDTSKKKPKTSTMTCIKLAKEVNTIDTSLYKKMF